MTRQALALAIFVQSVAAAETAWQWNYHRLPRVLAVQGLWNEPYRLAEALSEAGGADLREILHFHGAPSSGLHYLKGEGAYGLPKKPEDLLDYDLLVLTNVAARTFSKEQQELLKDFVSHGGGLLLLGGYWTLDKGGMRGTLFEEMLPVRITSDGARLPYELKGLFLEPKGSHPVTALADWSARPAVFFYNRAAPKEGSAVPVVAGEHPMLVLGECGKGRTAVFAGTVCGVAPEGVTAAWEWSDWPVFLASVIEWLWSPRREAPGGAQRAPKAASPGLSDEERENLAFAEEADKLALIRKAVANCDVQTASLLVEELAGNADLATDMQVSIMKAVRPFATAGWAKPLLGMGDRLDPGSRREWLPLLGATRSPEAVPVLLGSVDAADVDVRRAALNGLALLGSPKALPRLNRLFAEIPEFAADSATDEDEVTAALPGPEDLRVDALLALYQCGAPDTPQKVLDAYDQYLFYADFAAAFLRAPAPKPSDKQGRLNQKALIYSHQFMRSQLTQIRDVFIRVPDGLAKDFTRAANLEARPHCLRLIYQALETSLKPGNAVQFTDLCRAADPGVARLAASTVLELTGNAAGQSIAAALAEEWKGASALRRRRILMLARALPAEERRWLAEIGLSDPDPSVKRRAQQLLEAATTGETPKGE